MPDQNSSDQGYRYIVSHTSMRGIAAFLVVFYHLQFGDGFRFSWETETPFFASGYLWVDLFFILSGFVISYSTNIMATERWTWPQVKKFWLARFARIYPLHFFALLMLVAVHVAIWWLTAAFGSTPADDLWTHQKFESFMEQLFLLNAWGVSGQITWNVPTWSISAEAFAYLLFPILGLLLARFRSVFGVVVFAFSTFFYLWIAITTGVLDIVKGLAILRCLAGFGLGMVIYGYRKQIEGLPLALFNIGQILAVSLVIVSLATHSNDALIIPGFFLFVALTITDRGWLCHLLKARSLHWLGNISYSIYLNHFWVLAAAHFVLDRVVKLTAWSDGTVRAIVLVIEIAAVLVVSAFTYERIEKPLRRQLLNYFRPRQTAPL